MNGKGKRLKLRGMLQLYRSAHVSGRIYLVHNVLWASSGKSDAKSCATLLNLAHPLSAAKIVVIQMQHTKE